MQSDYSPMAGFFKMLQYRIILKLFIYMLFVETPNFAGWLCNIMLHNTTAARSVY
jgi:hypothetical protein